MSNNCKSALLLILFIFLIFMNVVDAQNFKGKLIVGLNASQVRGDGLGGFNKAGLIFGGAVEYPIREKVENKKKKIVKKKTKFSIQGEILYTQKGSKSTDKVPFFLIWRFNYIDVPILLNYYARKNLFFSLGPEVNFLLNAKFDNGSGFVEDDEAFRPVTFGMKGGAGYKFSPKSTINVNLTYSQSITKSGFDNLWPYNLMFTWQYTLNKLKSKKKRATDQAS